MLGFGSESGRPPRWGTVHVDRRVVPVRQAVAGQREPDRARDSVQPLPAVRRRAGPIGGAGAAAGVGRGPAAAPRVTAGVLLLGPRAGVFPAGVQPRPKAGEPGAAFRARL